MKKLIEYINESLVCEAKDVWSTKATEKAEFIKILDATFSDLKNDRIYSLDNKEDCKKIYGVFKEKSGIAYEQIPVIATIIIKRGLTKLAETAASPKIRPPIIPIVEPIGDGTLRLASRINSNETSIIKISNIIGNGIASLEFAIANKSSDGMSS